MNYAQKTTKNRECPNQKSKPKIERKKKKRRKLSVIEWLNSSASIHQSVFIRYFLPNYIKRRGGYCLTLFTSEIVRLTPLINPLPYSILSRRERQQNEKTFISHENQKNYMHNNASSLHTVNVHLEAKAFLNDTNDIITGQTYEVKKA